MIGDYFHHTCPSEALQRLGRRIEFAQLRGVECLPNVAPDRTRKGADIFST
jgi:hypothetical protein